MVSPNSNDQEIPNDLALPVFLYPKYWDNENFPAGKTLFREILEDARAKYRDGTWRKLFLTKTKSGTFRVKKESVALYIITHYLLIVTRETDKDSNNRVVYWYDPESGFWRPNARQKIAQLCQLILQKHKTIHYTREIIAHIEDYTLMPIEFNQGPHLLAVRNGILNLYTRELLPFNPKYLLTNGINVKYDPNASPTNYLKFLNEILNSDYQLLIQELWGDILFKEYRWQRIFFFYGRGRNGKGTLIRILKTFLGEGNYASQYFHDLQRDKNARAELEGKYVNFAGDMSKKPLRDTNVLKHLRGQEPMSARHLYENFFKFINHAILIANCNKPPRIEDDTESWQHTVMLIRFDKQFLGKDADRDLVDKLTTDEELSGILNWALDGLDRLLKNGDYSETKSGQDMFEQYKQVNSPVYAFASVYLKHVPIKSKKWCENVWICDDKLWRIFKSFCSDNDLEISAKRNFTLELSTIFPKVRRKQVRRGERVESQNNRRKALLTWIGLDFQESDIIDEDFELELDENFDVNDGQTTLYDTINGAPLQESLSTYQASPSKEGYRGVAGTKNPFDLFMLAWDSFIQKNKNGDEKGISLEDIKVKFPFLTQEEIELDLLSLLAQSVIFKPKEGFYKPI